VHAAGDHFEHATAVLGAQLQSRRADVQHVAAAQPHCASQRRAVVQDGRGVGHRLQEQLAVVQPEPRARAGRRGQHDARPLAAERQREVAGAEQAVAERFAQQQFGAQIGSSQRITTAGASRPGSRLISRRTSRKPGRTPTTV
jgi:hypothetical protein